MRKLLLLITLMILTMLALTSSIVLSILLPSSPSPPPLLQPNQFAFATLADTSSPVISSFDVNPKVLGPNDVTEHGYPRVIAEAQVSDNVGVTNVAVYAYPEGTTDLVGQALQGIPLVEGNLQDGEWRGVYALWPPNTPDGEYELYVRARDAANNEATAGPITVTIDRIPPPDPEPPVISSFDVNPKVLGPNDVLPDFGNPWAIAQAHVSDNVGVTVVAVYAYPEGTTDLVGGALQQIGLVEGNPQDGEWRGIYALWPRDAPDGRYEVYVEARDAAGNKNTEGPIIVTIDRIPQSEDTTAPVIAIPDDITEEATGPDGAEISFEVTAEDEVDGAVDVSCDYNSGDIFPIGQTVVTCTAEDAAGNPAEESFTITVQDTTAPDVEITGAVDRSGREITDGSGRTPIPYIRITFEATDAVGIDEIECSLDGQPFTSCESPISYDRLSRTIHEVTVRATDEAGNTGEDEFSWTVGAPPSNSGGSSGRNR